MKKKVLLILFTGLIVTSFQIRKKNVIRLNEPSFLHKTEEIIPHIIDFQDTIQGDTLFEYISENRMPMMYSRKIQTGVCIDGKCRMVNIELFWYITGRYLGFKLPDREFLSKTEHVQFNSNEYDRLHQLLSDPYSVLANYSLTELIPEQDTTKTMVDAVSAATISAVRDYIVKDAVYTTYTLWHIVYGPTKHQIEKLTSERFSSKLILEILNSKNSEDQIWVINSISGNNNISDEIQNKLLKNILGKDASLSKQTLIAIKPEILTSEFQIKLVAGYDRMDFLQKQTIIQKLMDVSELNDSFIEKLSSTLNNSNGILVKSILEIFTIHKTHNILVEKKVAELLKNKNRFIANYAFIYLKKQKDLNKNTLRDIQRYKNNKY